MTKRRSQGDGALYFVESTGLWTASIELPPDPRTGKRRRKVIRAKRHADAMKKLKTAMRDLDRIGDLASSTPKYRDFVEGSWIPALYRKRLKPQTINGYVSDQENYLLPLLGDIKVDAITQRHVHLVLSAVHGRGLSSRTEQKAFRTLSLTLTAAMRQGLTVRNVCDYVEPPTLVQKPREALTLAQAKLLLKGTAGTPDFPLILLLLATGARKGEALGLRVEDVDFTIGVLTFRHTLQRLTWKHGCKPACGRKRGADCPQREQKLGAGIEATQVSGTLWLTTPKSKTSMRAIPMIPPLAEALRRHIRVHGLKPGDFVFGNQGQPLTPEAFYEGVKAILAPFGAAYSPHSLRHTATTLMDEAGVSEAHRIAMLGHSSAQMTRHYTHTTQGALAGDLAKFDQLLGIEG